MITSCGMYGLVKREGERRWRVAKFGSAAWNRADWRQVISSQRVVVERACREINHKFRHKSYCRNKANTDNGEDADSRQPRFYITGMQAGESTRKDSPLQGTEKKQSEPSTHRPVQLDAGTHKRIRAIAETESERQQRRVTYVEVVRMAIDALEKGGRR